MKITEVDAFYIRLPEVKEQCDSGQDVLVVKVHTDEGITGIGEVDSAPLAAQSAISGPYSHTITSGLKHLVIGEDLRDRVFVGQNVPAEYLRRPFRDRDSCDERHRHCALGH